MEIIENKEIIQKINYYCKRLGLIANLAFMNNSLSDLELLLTDLEELDEVCNSNLENYKHGG